MLLEHPAVAEAGVIGKPDPVVGEVVKAFVALRPGHAAGEGLRLELLGHARKRLGPVVAPKEIDFVDSVPKNRAGKIMRRVLKAREPPASGTGGVMSDERIRGTVLRARSTTASTTWRRGCKARLKLPRRRASSAAST